MTAKVSNEIAILASVKELEFVYYFVAHLVAYIENVTPLSADNSR